MWTVLQANFYLRRGHPRGRVVHLCPMSFHIHKGPRKGSQS